MLDLRFRQTIYDYSIKNGKYRAAKDLGVDYKTVCNLHKLFKEQGNLLPKKRQNYEIKVKQEELIDFVEQNPNLNLKEIAENFNCTDANICYLLKKLNFSLKKSKNF